MAEPRSFERGGFIGWGLGLSALLHAIAFSALLSRSGRASSEPPRVPVSFEVRAPPLPKPVEPSQPPKPRPPEQVPARAHAERLPPPAAVRQPTPDDEPPSAPVDLSGITLTDPGSVAGFAAPAGDGSTRVAALRRSALSAAPPSVAAAPPVPVPPRAADLSERPKPPQLDGLLRANYPEAKRQLGIEGDASVRAEIDPDGRVRAASVVHESEAGFGVACRKTVLGSIWSPALDRQSRRVATAVVYRCRFRIDR